MDTKTLLDDLLASAKNMAEKDKTVAEEKLNMPEAGPERDAMLSGLSKGAMAAGALALLVGTRGGRAITGTAIKLGSLAALGGFAYKTYKGWQNGDETTADDIATPVQPTQSLGEEERHSRLILSAMIAAAKSDGHVDENERASLQNYIDKIGESEQLSQFVEAELAKSLDAKELAAQVPNQEVAAEVYLASLLIADQSEAKARVYLAELANALELPDDLVAKLNDKVDPVV